ncbi:MAG: pyridoxal-phosphate dependent enzyme, partial [Sciscionella sp.]
MTDVRGGGVIAAHTVAIDDRRVLVLDLAANEAGSHKLRAATGIVQAAARDGYDSVAAGSCGNYGLAVAIAARDVGIAATVTLPAGWGDDHARIRGAGAPVELVYGGYED